MKQRGRLYGCNDCRTTREVAYRGEGLSVGKGLCLKERMASCLPEDVGQEAGGPAMYNAHWTNWLSSVAHEILIFWWTQIHKLN